MAVWTLLILIVALFTLIAGVAINVIPARTKAKEIAVSGDDHYHRELIACLTPADKMWLRAMGWIDPTPPPSADELWLRHAGHAWSTVASKSVTMCHPLLQNHRAEVSLTAVDDHARNGWLLVD